MLKTSNPSNMPPPAGYYSQVVEVPPNARWVVLAGQICVRPDGTTPEGFEAQHDQIWQNTIAALESVGHLDGAKSNSSKSDQFLLSKRRKNGRCLSFDKLRRKYRRWSWPDGFPQQFI